MSSEVEGGKSIENGKSYECRNLGKTHGEGLLTYPVASFYKKAKTFRRSMELSVIQRNWIILFLLLSLNFLLRPILLSYGNLIGEEDIPSWSKEYIEGNVGFGIFHLFAIFPNPYFSHLKNEDHDRYISQLLWGCN